MIDERKKVQTTPSRTYCKPSRPLPYSNPNKQDAPALKVYPASSHHPTTPNCLQKFLCVTYPLIAYRISCVLLTCNCLQNFLCVTYPLIAYRISCVLLTCNCLQNFLCVTYPLLLTEFLVCYLPANCLQNFLCVTYPLIAYGIPCVSLTR